MEDGLPGFFDDTDIFADAASPEDLFRILEHLEDKTAFSPRSTSGTRRSNSSIGDPRNIETDDCRDEDDDDDDVDDDAVRAKKKFKLTPEPTYGQPKVSHITVERNRRKQMNEHLSALRSLMPCFYVKRGDQASIVGGVVDYITELQQVLQSLEAKKQRKAYSEVLSPRPPSLSPKPSPLSPKPSPLSPRPSVLSPRVGLLLPISPKTPTPGSPYKPKGNVHVETPVPSFDNIGGGGGDLAANSKSAVADVEVKFSGPNLILKTVSHRIPGQAMKIIAALEGLPLEILHISISTTDEIMLNSFTIKIGIECKLSAEELAQEIQQTFS